MGWAWNANQPNSPINVDIYDGATLIATIAADQFRQDLLNAGIGNGYHAFSLSTPASLKDGQTHSIRVKFSGTSTDLGTTPKSLICAPIYQGYHDGADCQSIVGWAWNANQPNSPINVDIYDGATLIATVAADQFRQDLLNAGIGNGYHAFSLSTPASLKDGQTHSIRVKFSGTSTDLGTTPKSITCGQPGCNNILPSGDTSGLTDWSNINSALQGASHCVTLAAGTFYINQPIQAVGFPAGVSLTGAGKNQTKIYPVFVCGDSRFVDGDGRFRKPIEVRHSPNTVVSGFHLDLEQLRSDCGHLSESAIVVDKSDGVQFSILR